MAPTDGHLPLPPPKLPEPGTDYVPRSRSATVALRTSVAGWGVFVWVGASILFTGQEINCTAHRNDAYRDCVRGSDLNGLRILSFVIGLAMVGLVVALRGLHRERQRQTAVVELRAAVSAALSLVLAIACVLVWVRGTIDGWQPDRPFAYEPVSASQANTIIATGTLLGIFVGALFPLGRRSG